MFVLAWSKVLTDISEKICSCFAISCKFASSPPFSLMPYVIKCHFCLLYIALLCSFWAVFPFKNFALLYLTKYHFIYFKKFLSSIFLYLWKNASRKERYSLTMSIQYTRRIGFPCIWCRLKQDYKSIQLWWIYFLANLLTKRCIFISSWLRENYNLISAAKFLYPNFYHSPNSILVQFSFHSFNNFCRPFLIHPLL